MSKGFFLFILVLMIALLSQQILGVGIGSYSSEKEILFKPGESHSYMFSIFDSQKIHVDVEGSLAKYVTLSDPSPDGGPRTVNMIINFPDSQDAVSPGIHTIYLVATEMSESSATVGGIASVRTGIRVVSLYDGKYPEFSSLSVNDFNVNDTGNITLGITNYGKSTIIQTYGTITIYDSNNNTITTLYTNNVSIFPYMTRTISVGLDSSQYVMAPGKYRAVANITYDGIGLNSTRLVDFLVGEMKVDVTSATDKVYANATNKYDINVESDWASDINNVYAIVKTPDGKSLKTPNINIAKSVQGSKSDATLETYWDTTGMNLGNYTTSITIYYNGVSSSASMPVEVIEGTAPPIDRQAGLPITTIIIAILVIISAIGIYLYIKNKREGESSDSEDIRPPSL